MRIPGIRGSMTRAFKPNPPGRAVPKAPERIRTSGSPGSKPGALSAELRGRISMRMEGVEPPWIAPPASEAGASSQVSPHPRVTSQRPRPAFGGDAPITSSCRARPVGCRLVRPRVIPGLAADAQLDHLRRVLVRARRGHGADQIHAVHPLLLSLDRAPRGALRVRGRRGRSPRSAAASRCRSRRRRAVAGRCSPRSRSRSRPCRP